MKKGLKLLMGLMILTIIALAFVGCSTTPAEEEIDYQYYTAYELMASIRNEIDLFIVDIQLEEEYEAHHIEGVIATYAYPVETDDDKAKLDSVLPQLEASEAPIVIVSPMGDEGAKRTIDYLVGKGISVERLVILENGQADWPYEEYLEN